MRPLNRIVLFVNGFPHAGKDTTIGVLTRLLSEQSVPTLVLSSIDPVRDMLRGVGVPVDRKGEEERVLLAEVGASLEKYNFFRTHYVADAARQFFNAHRSGVVMAQMREPAHIERCQGMLDACGIASKTLLVTSDRSMRIFSNPVDAGVEALRYNFRIDNSGSIADLEHASRIVIDQLMQLIAQRSAA